MPFKLRQATPSDKEAVADVFFSAFSKDRVIAACIPPTPECRKAWIEGLDEELEDPETHVVCVVDTELQGEPIVAFAIWLSPIATARPPPSGYPKGGDEELSAYFFPLLVRERQERLAGRKCWYLHILACHEAHQGRGAGGILMRYGLEHIDADGADGYIEASPAGAPVYKRFGFHAVDRIVLDVGSEVELMIREAPQK